MRELVDKILNMQLFRFGLVGGAGFFVNEAALFLAHWAGAGPTAAWFLAFLPAVIFTWWGNRNLTFAAHASDHRVGMLLEFAIFFAASSVGLTANFCTYYAFTHFAPAPFNIMYIALGFGVLVGLIFNFTLSKKFAFRKWMSATQGNPTPPPSQP